MKFTKRQTEIIIAATELIGAHGVQRLTTKSLAARIGFSEPALYRHFKDKNDLLRSILLYFKENMGEGLKNIVYSDLNGLDKLKLIIDYQFNFFIKFPAVIMVIFAETSFQDDESLSKTVQEILEDKRVRITKIINNGQEEGCIRSDIDSEQLTKIIMGSMRVTVLNWRLNNYSFKLREESDKLQNSIEILFGT